MKKLIADIREHLPAILILAFFLVVLCLGGGIPEMYQGAKGR